jgi:hypothetical protein
MAAGPATAPLPKARDRSKAKRSAGRFATLNFFLDVTLRTLSRSEAAIWLLLFRDTKPNGLARTGQADLARRSGCDIGTVKRALAKLAAKRLLSVVRRGRSGVGPTIYWVWPISTELTSAGAPLQGRISRPK